MQRIFIVLFLLAILPPAFAQNARPAIDTSKLLENEQIRVRELRLKPGEKLAAQSFPNTFVYGLTDGALVFAPPGRTPYELTFKAGEALWLSAQEAATQNETDKDVRVLLVEIKQRPPVAAAKKGKASGKGSKAGGKGKSGGKPAAKSGKTKKK